MKVLYLTCIPAPYKVNFLNELSKLCELTVIFERETASDRDKNWKTDEKYNFKHLFLHGIEYSNDASCSMGAINHLRNNIYDNIIFGVYHTATAMITMQYLKNKGVPFILSSDGGFCREELGIKKWIKSHFISMADYYLSPGGDTDRYLEYYGAIRSRIFRYPFTSVGRKDIKNSVIEAREKRTFREMLDIKEKKVLLSVGQFIYRKGFDVLLEAAEKLDNQYVIYIIGGKPTEEYILMKEKIKSGVNIHFIPFMKKEKLDRYYLAADLFVFPTREDIWGLVVVEALAKGVPVITTDKCNAGLELIQSGYNGYVIKKEDPNAMSTAIKKCFENNLNDMSQNALDSVALYSYSDMAYSHYETLKRIYEGEIL